ncbi:hypothetical protein BDZ85DRAFT_320172 [Elsinoe ampelina]|uniref:Uncharacterized protein n=1 Tax=Elsinoe ampelina TaxID=302913 RepID=A0A6A6G929_9PEZI|nr:hypothetical protein BDZ85DRAFT_320172 [Elsinoe ampelina]
MPYLDDRHIYIGLGLTLLLSTRLISLALHRTTTLNLIHPSPTHPHATPPSHPAPSSPSSTPSLPLPSLSTLSSSPNPDIARSATRLLLERLASSPTARSSFIDDIFSPRPHVRRQAKYLADLYAKFYPYEGEGENPLAPWRGLLGRGDVASETPAERTVRRAYGLARGMEGRDGGDAVGRLRRLSGAWMGGRRGVVVCQRMREGQVVVWIEVMRGLVERGWDKGNVALGARLIGEAREMEGLEPGEVWEVLKGDWLEGDRRGKSGGGLRLARWDDEDDEAEIGWGGIDGDASNLPLARVERRPRFHEGVEVEHIRRRRREAMVLHEGEGVVDRDDIIQRYTNDE